jgi:hypothetical protein
VPSGLPSRWGGDRGRRRTADVRDCYPGADASLRAFPRCSFITGCPLDRHPSVLTGANAKRFGEGRCAGRWSSALAHRGHSAPAPGKARQPRSADPIVWGATNALRSHRMQIMSRMSNSLTDVLWSGRITADNMHRVRWACSDGAPGPPLAAYVRGFDSSIRPDLLRARRPMRPVSLVGHRYGCPEAAFLSPTHQGRG